MDKKIISDDSGTDLLNPSDALQEFLLIKKCESSEILKTLQKILGFCQREIMGNISQWHPLIIELLEFMINQKQQDKQLLAGRIIFSILSKKVDPPVIEDFTKQFLRIEKNVKIFSHNFEIPDPEMFKLIIINSNLHINPQIMNSPEIYNNFFEIIHKHCITYTKRTFLGFRLLKLWLNSTRGTTIWKNDEGILEKRLESLITSNWDNCLNDVAKWNATEIYPIYLIIMQDKYQNYLEKSLDLVLDRLSWKNPTKFTILTGISTVMTVSPEINDHHVKEIVKSLIKRHLKHPSIRLYSAIWGRMDEHEWLNFYRIVHPIIQSWEKEDNLYSLQLFWDLWLKPTISKFSHDFFHCLWPYLFVNNMIISQSFFLKIAVERGIKLMSLLESYEYDRNGGLIENVWIRDESTGVPFVFNDQREYVRLNGFAIYCLGAAFDDYDYDLCKNFIYFNAKAASTHLRKGILDNLKILIEKVSKRDIRDEEINFSRFLHEFLLNCFEIGSCYQRKIIGLSLYRIILEFGKKQIQKADKMKKNQRKCIKFCEIEYNSKKCFYSLARLCLDTVDEIRSKSCEILCNDFDPTELTDQEKKTLFEEGMRNIRSCKFYEISGGGKLLKILTTMTGRNLSVDLLQEAKKQLSAMREDILKAATEGSPFYGALTAIFETCDFKKNQSNDLDNGFVLQLLELLEEASIFFLSSLSPAPETPKYSSSFAEMGIAIQCIITKSSIINDSEECTLSPTHQTILSCIWMSLATISELSGKLTNINSLREDIYIRLINIVVTILMKCRHKGVIEAAGVVLGRLMNNKNIKEDYFLQHLNNLLSLDSNDKIDLTRRGAGQTILFHNLITHGDKQNRPLLISSLERILNSLRTHSIINYSDNSSDNPIARQLHFLRTIVEDKSLHHHLLQFMEDISLICFIHLKSIEWSIRNASLQLLGAIVPRLIGQCDNDLEGGGYSIEHFCMHYPNLSRRLSEELIDRNDGVIMASLTLLSKMTVSGDYHDYSDGFRRDISQQVYYLFDHKVSMIRNLAAKTYSAFIPPRDIGKTIFFMGNYDLNGHDNNFRHTYLLTLVYLHIRGEYECLGCDLERILEITGIQLKRFDNLFKKWCNDEVGIDYVVESTFIKCLLASSQLKKCGEFKIDEVGHLGIMRKIEEERNCSGFWEFIDHLVEIHWIFADFDECLRDSPEVFLGIQRYNLCFIKSVKNVRRISDDGEEMELRRNLLNCLFKELLIMVETFDFNVDKYFKPIFEFTLNILEKSCYDKINKANCLHLEIVKILPWLVIHPRDNSDYLRKFGFKLIIKTLYNEHEWERFFFDYVSREIHDENLEKLWILDSLEEYINNKKGVIKPEFQVRIAEALVIFLNDECPEIRALVNKLFKIFPGKESNLLKHSEIYVHEMLKFGVDYYSSFGIKGFDDFVKNVMNNRCSKEFRNIKSPFNYDESYREDGKVVNIISQLVIEKKGFMNNSSSVIDFNKIIETGRDYLESFITISMENSNSCKLSTFLNIRFDDYVSYKLKKLYEIM